MKNLHVNRQMIREGKKPLKTLFTLKKDFQETLLSKRLMVGNEVN